METSLQKEVNSIKKWLALGVIVSSVSTISIFGIYIFTFSKIDQYEKECCEKAPWDDEAYDAIDEAKYDQALSLANNRLKTHPNDADAFYIKAQVAFFTGNREEAKMYLLHTKALSPSWDAEYIKPLQEAIEENAFNAALKAQPSAAAMPKSGTP